MERIPLKELISPARPFLSLWARRDLLMQIVQRNIQSRYKASMFGLFWMLATPLFMLAIYTFVFSVVFKARWGDDFGDSRTAFALIMFCGISVFNIFSESISCSVGVIPGNQNYVKKVVFPLEILPVAAVLSALVFGLVSIAILLAGLGLFLHTLTITAICLPLILLPLLLLSTGLAWFVASLGTYFRDLQHAIGILLQMLFFMTPIFYKIEQLPESFRFFLQLNPLASVIQQSRRILIFGQWPVWGELLLLIGVSLLIFQLGYIWFMKTKRGFADVL